MRLETTSGASGGDTDDAGVIIEEIIVSLESENHALRQQLIRSDAEVARLRQRLQGNHDVLPVVVPSLSVDLSRLDTGLVVQIASFVGTSRELLNLALTCKYFGRRQWHLGSASELSLVEEVARQAVRCKQNSESFRLSLPEYVRGRVTWLSILHELDATEIQLSVGTPHRTLKR